MLKLCDVLSLRPLQQRSRLRIGNDAITTEAQLEVVEGSKVVKSLHPERCKGNKGSHKNGSDV